MGIHRRVQQLERAANQAGLGRPCPGCGYAPGCRPEVRIIPAGVVKNLSEALALEKSRDTSKDFCKVCGRQLIFRIPLPQIARLGASAVP